MPKKLPFSDDVLALNPELRQAGAQDEARVGRGLIRGVRRGTFRSHLEVRAWDERDTWLSHVKPLCSYEIRYEPITLGLHVEGVRLRRYTPDFVVRFSDQRLWFVEVKGSWSAHPSGRSSKMNLIHAAVEYQWLGKFFVLTPETLSWSGWALIEVLGDETG